MADPSEQVDKVIQLYEVMMTRHTTMVVGQTGGGKTVILNTLARTQTRLGKKTSLFTINPKVTTRTVPTHTHTHTYLFMPVLRGCDRPCPHHARAAPPLFPCFCAAKLTSH